MKRWSQLLVAVVCTLASVWQSSHAQTSSMWVNGYYPIWSVTDMPASKMNWQGLTHVIHFGINPDSTAPYWLVKQQDSLDLVRGGGWVWPANGQSIPDSLVKYAHMNGVKALLSCGGIYGVGGQTMRYITDDSVRTQVFANRLLAFAKRYSYDGLEVDWESYQTRDNMSRLIRILRRGLSGWPQKGSLVLAAAYGLEDIYDIALKDSVDQYNVMMYDMNFVGSGYCFSCPQDVSGYNAPLYSPDATTYPMLHTMSENYAGVRPIISSTPHAGPAYWISKGMPAKKIAIGVPFYGYCYRGLSAPNQLRNNVYAQYISYPNIELAMQSGGVRHWDDASRVPWLNGTATQAVSWFVNAGEQFFITYDDTASMREKVRFAKQLGLGGIMIYELWQGWFPSRPAGQQDPLLRALVSEVNNAVVQPPPPPPPTAPTGTFAATPATLPAGGGSVTLSWTSTNATTASIDQGVGSVALSGSSTVMVTANKTFTLHLVNSTGSIDIAAPVTVQAAAGQSGRDLSSLGTPVAFITAPTGIGNHSLEVIRDGVTPAVGSTNPALQYDTYNGTARTSDWVGYTFTQSYSFARVVFQEGLHFGDGGWFGSLKIQVRINGTWTDVSATVCTPAYAGNNGTSFDTYDMCFPAVTGDGIRIYGTLTGGAGFISVGELRAFESAAAQVPVVPQLSSPVAGAGNQSSPVTLSWNSVSGATRYCVQVATDSLFAGITLQDSTLTSTARQVAVTGYVTKYFWRVRAIGASGSSAFSAPFNFTTAPATKTGMHFAFTGNTGNNATMAIPAAVNPVMNGVAMIAGDEIAVFTPAGLCVGSTEWPATGTASIVVWGDNDQTPAVDGLRANEPLVLRMWRSATNTEYPNVIAHYAAGDSVYYKSDGLFTLSQLVTSSGGPVTTTPQTIVLRRGWNMISENVQPSDASMLAIGSQLSPNFVIAKNGSGQVYWPAQSVDQIGLWNFRQAYLVNVSAADTLLLQGTRIVPETNPLALTLGWNLTAYLRTTAMRVDSALSTIASKIVIAKDNDGRVYWPSKGISTLDSLRPGQGYKINVNAAATLTFAANAAGAAKEAVADGGSVNSVKATTHYVSTLEPTGVTATLLVEGLVDDQEVAAWSNGGRMIGSGAVQNGRALLSLMGDNALTDGSVEGAVEGESIQLSVWSPRQGERMLTLGSLVDGLTGSDRGLVFSQDAVMLGAAKESADAAAPSTYALEQNYPNPFNPSTEIRFSVPATGHVSLTVFNMLGQTVATLVNGVKESGSYTVRFNATQLASGMYVYRLQGDGFMQTRKMMLLK